MSVSVSPSTLFALIERLRETGAPNDPAEAVDAAIQLWLATTCCDAANWPAPQPLSLSWRPRRVCPVRHLRHLRHCPLLLPCPRPLWPLPRHPCLAMSLPAPAGRSRSAENSASALKTSPST